MYEGCLLYFEIRGQKQILIFGNRIIVFQNNPPLYNAFEPIVKVLLPLRLIDFFERLTNCVGSNVNKFF